MTRGGSAHTPWRVPLPQAPRHVPALSLSLQRVKSAGAKKVVASSMQAICVVPPLIFHAAAQQSLTVLGHLARLSVGSACCTGCEQLGK